MMDDESVNTVSDFAVWCVSLSAPGVPALVLARGT